METEKKSDLFSQQLDMFDPRNKQQNAEESSKQPHSLGHRRPVDLGHPPKPILGPGGPGPGF